MFRRENKIYKLRIADDYVSNLSVIDGDPFADRQ